MVGVSRVGYGMFKVTFPGGETEFVGREDLPVDWVETLATVERHTLVWFPTNIFGSFVQEG